MKICYINPTVLLKRPIAEIIDILGKKHKLSLLIPQKKRLDSSMHYSDVKKAKIISYKTIQPLIASEFPIPCPTLLLIRSWKLLKNNDVIHMWVPFYLSTSFTPILKRLFFKKKKLILTMDTIPAYSFSMGPFMDILFKIYYKTLGKIVFSCVDQITLYGKSLIPYAKKAGLPLKKVKITPTGIKQRTNPVTKVIRREFNIKKDEKIALFVGIINPRKGVDTVIKVAKKLKNQNIKFIIVGDGPAKKQYQKQAKKLKLDNIIFTGFRKDIHNFYQQSDILFFPSKGEGLAGVIMESMIYGLPVISSKIPCTEDLIKHNHNGLLCPTNSVECYIQMITKLLKDKKLQQKFIKNSKKRIKEYSWEKNIKEFERLYN